MSNPTETFTYRNGTKVKLTKSDQQFIVSASPAVLEHEGFTQIEQVSTGSSRITTTSSDMEREMARARFIAPTHHVYRLNDSGQDFILTDQVIVTFQPGVTENQITEFMSRYALLLSKKYSATEFLFQLTNHTGMNPVKLVRKLTEDEPLVLSVDHNLRYQVQKYAFQLPADWGYQYQWHLHPHFQHAEVDSRAASMCEGAWKRLGSFGSDSVVIAITDDGCQMTHHDLNSPGKFAGWAYWHVGAGPNPSIEIVKNTDPGADPTKMYQEGQNHGTHCAGVAVAEADADLTIGAAPGCHLLPIKWPSYGRVLDFTDDMMEETLQWISTKADIVSNSWGSAPLNLFATKVVNTVQRLATSGGPRGKGIVFVWSAGNENCPINLDTNIKVPFDIGWRDGLYPEWVGVQRATQFRNNLVDIPQVLHIAALASNAQRSHYSNYGPGVDLCAPTDNGHTYYRAYVAGLPILTTSGENLEAMNFFGGTSSAAPLIAGIAALVISANPDLTASEVVSILKQTASKDLDMTGYPRTAPATYDPNPVWDVSPVAPFDKGDFQDIGDPDGTWSPWFGHGRVDASAAVAEALRLRPPNSVTKNGKNGKNGHASSRKARSVERSVAER